MAGLVDEVYTIQDILAHDYRPIPGRRTSNKGILYFLIRWQGYGSEADTWEPSHNIICSSVVKEYWHRRKEQEQAQETKEKKTGRILLTKKEDDTLRCDVCLGMDGMVLRCAVCTIPVHAHCYGTTNIASCGIWVCEACAAADGKSKSKACIFCPTTNHHLKSLPDGRWAHIICLLWNGYVRFADERRRSGVIGLMTIPLDLQELKCGICQSTRGVCCHCQTPTCREAFHVGCARNTKGYQFDPAFALPAIGRGIKNRYVPHIHAILCPKHAVSKKQEEGAEEKAEKPKAGQQTKAKEGGEEKKEKKEKEKEIKEKTRRKRRIPDSDDEKPVIKFTKISEEEKAIVQNITAAVQIASAEPRKEDEETNKREEKGVEKEMAMVQNITAAEPRKEEETKKREEKGSETEIAVVPCLEFPMSWITVNLSTPPTEPRKGGDETELKEKKQNGVVLAEYIKNEHKGKEEEEQVQIPKPEAPEVKDNTPKGKEKEQSMVGGNGLSEEEKKCLLENIRWTKEAGEDKSEEEKREYLQDLFASVPQVKFKPVAVFFGRQGGICILRKWMVQLMKQPSSSRALLLYLLFLLERLYVAEGYVAPLKRDRICSELLDLLAIATLENPIRRAAHKLYRVWFPTSQSPPLPPLA